MKRYCEKHIAEDLTKKMVFIGGPRQVGKTTLSKRLLQTKFRGGEYFNWDADEDREAIRKKRWKSSSPLIVFDELHKFTHWKRWIKGVYDVRPEGQQYLVTGSARLDVYRRGGDSLMGRYHYWRLHPLTLDELPRDVGSKEGYERLLKLGGFPEPFLSGDEREARRWRKERFDKVLREDVRDLENIRDIRLLQLFVDLLRTRVGGLITLSNLAEDLQISPKTAKAWLLLMERMYAVFAVYPYVKQMPRSIQKPPKVYFYDNADTADDEGMRLENLVATTLLKRLHYIEDFHGYRCSLHYVRDKDGHEVDFVTVIDGKVDELIEVKHSDANIATSLRYYADRIKHRAAVQIVGDLKRPFDTGGIHVTNPIAYFSKPLWVRESR